MEIKNINYVHIVSKSKEHIFLSCSRQELFSTKTEEMNLNGMGSRHSYAYELL